MSVDLKTLAGRLTSPESFYQRIHPNGEAQANYVGGLAFDRSFPLVEYNLRIGDDVKSAARLFGHGYHWKDSNQWPKFQKLMGDADGLAEAAAKIGAPVDMYRKTMHPRVIVAVSSPSGVPTFACIRHDLLTGHSESSYMLGLESHRKTAVKIQGVVKDVVGSFRSLSAIKRNLMENYTYTTAMDGEDMLVTVKHSIYGTEGEHLLFKEVQEACDELILEGGAPAFVCDYPSLTTAHGARLYQEFLLSLAPFQQLLVVRVSGLVTGVPEKIFFQPLPLGAAGAYLYIGGNSSTPIWGNFTGDGETTSMPLRILAADIAAAGGDPAQLIAKRVRAHQESLLDYVDGTWDSGSWNADVHQPWYFRPTQADFNWPSFNASGGYDTMTVDGSAAKVGSPIHSYIMYCAEALGFWVDPNKAGALATSFAGAVMSHPLGLIAGLPHEPEVVVIELGDFQRHDSVETIPESARIKKWEEWFLAPGTKVDYTAAQPKRVMKWTATSVTNRISSATLHKAVEFGESAISTSQTDLKLEILRFPWHFAGRTSVVSGCKVPYKDLKLINQLKRAGGSDDDLTIDDGDEEVITFLEAYQRAEKHKVNIFYGSLGTELASPGNVPAALWIEGEAPTFHVFVYEAKNGPDMVKGAELTKEDAALFHMMGATLHTAEGVKLDDAIQALFGFPDSDTMHAVVAGASTDISLDDATLCGGGARFAVMTDDELTRFHVMQSIKDRHHIGHLCVGALTGALGMIPFTPEARDFTEEELASMNASAETVGYQM